MPLIRTVMFNTVLRFSVLAIAGILLSACTRSPEEKLAKYLAKGKQYHAARDYRRAILEFKNAVMVNPRDAEPHYQLGLEYFSAGDLASAMAEFRKTAELNPNHSGANAKLANILVATRNSDLINQGEQLAQKAVRAAPNDVDALNALALAEIKTGSPEDAARHFEMALEKLPQSLKAAANLASIKLSRKDVPGAEEVLKKVAAQLPKSSKPPIALGRFYLVVNRPAEAEAQFRRALELDPKDAVAMRDLAEFLQLQGKNEEAEHIYKRLSDLPYKASKPLYAMFLYKTGKRDAAALELEKLLAQDPKDRELRTYLVSAYFSDGKLSKAAKIIAAALKANPRDNDALLQHAVVSVASRQFEDAERDANTVLHYKPDSGTAHYLLAKVRQAHGDPGGRRQELTSAVRLNPTLLQARLELNQALIEGNAAAAALDLLDQTPANQKGGLGYLISRNWTLMALGNWAELRKSVDESLKGYNASELLLQDGMLRVQQRDFKNAEKSLEQVLQRNPEDLRALKVLAGIHILQNQNALALQTVQEHVQRRPSSGVLQNYLGQCLLAEGKTTQAKSAFLAAKAADPNVRGVDLSLAEIDISQGNVQGARNKLLQLTDVNGDVSARLALASIEQSAGNGELAASHYRAVLQQDANNLIALNNLAYLLAEAEGGTNEALQYARRAKDLAPNDPLITDTLAWVFIQKKMPKLAIEQLEAAVSKQPSIAPIYYHLAVAYQMAGDKSRARDRVQTALKLDPKMSEALVFLRYLDEPARK